MLKPLLWIGVGLLFPLTLTSPTLAQSITAAPDGTGTLVTLNGNTYHIQGGTQAGANLFHSFQDFGLSSGEIANFLSDPSIANIFGRVTGGDPSVIDGLVQANPNLYLMNPAGIVFGANASLNVGGDFTATTATGMEFAQGVWTTDSQDYAALSGTPQAFVFTDGEAGAIANAGHLQVGAGQNLNLVGSSVLHTGRLTAQGGNLQVMAVPGTNRVKISQPDSLLSLEITNPGSDTTLNPLDLPQLLTGSGLTPDSLGVEFGNDGQLYVPGSSIPIPTSPGSVTVTGTLNASTTSATDGTPRINLDGDKVALLGAELDASGTSGGGRIRIGETATRTFADRDSRIRADATGDHGDGGDILVWSDDVTAFYGQLSAQGGAQGGDGGFVEVSALVSLMYDGQANLDAPFGEMGTLFLDPININVVGAPASPGDGNLPSIFANDPGSTFVISGTALAAQTGNVILEATNTININTNVSLSTPHLVLRAPNVNLNGDLTGSSLTIAADHSTISGSFTGDNTGTLTLTTFSPTEGLRIGSLGDEPGFHDLSQVKIDRLNGFGQVVWGDPNHTGMLAIENTPVLQNALAMGTTSIAGAGMLQMGYMSNWTDATTWELTGANQGQFNAFGSAIAFSNVQQITGGTGADTFVFNDGVNFNGLLDGGGGLNTLDYSRSTTAVTVDLAASQALGTTGALNMQNVILPALPPTVAAPPTVSDPNLQTQQAGLDSNQGSSSGSGSQDVMLPDRNAISQLLDGDDIAGAITGLESLFGSEIADYLGKSDRSETITLEEIQGILREQSTATGSPSAMIYALVRSQYLELILVTELAEPLHYRVPVSDRALLETIRTFRREITDPVRRLTTSYLPAAQELHQWLIAPLQADLDRFNIDTLIFSLDQGLRTLPLAALHNGENFLIEDYGLSVVPSLSLTQTTRTPQADARVLAMGVAEFANQPPLPTVPVELAAVAKTTTKDNVSLLNQDFTWKNWQQQQQEPFNVVHIATHAEFRSGQIENSYIQLWDERIGLDQLGTIPWRDQAVELLVLSACRTAFGSTEAEFGFAGLAVQTGVPAAIASIWYANDVGTLVLMNELYRHLPESATRANALRQAQLALLRGEATAQNTLAEGVTLPATLERYGDRNWRHPYYWSAFTLVGSPW
ncbi:MAG: CHAT domain-containing protein [Spirulinaceae cyanobacterium]